MHVEVAAELPQDLPARAARRRGLLGVRDNRDPRENVVPFGERLEYRDAFGTDARVDFPELQTLIEEGWAEPAEVASIRLTPAGLERSDAIGPLFYSAAMNRRMDEYELE